MGSPSLTAALAAGPVVLDGGLATDLEAHGYDLSGPTWSARLLYDEPDAVRAAHLRFFASGAQVAITASYQVSRLSLDRVGLGNETDLLLRRSVRLAASAREEMDRPVGRAGGLWVAASVGPYGASRADGSEYTGDYGLSVSALRRFHRARLHVLAEAGADVLAVETIPSQAEAEAVLAEVDGLGVPVWLCYTCAGPRTRHGEAAEQAFAVARGVREVVAVGLNCSSPTDTTILVPTAHQASGRPVVAYPNSGERWDARARRWRGPAAFDPAAVGRWLAGGARMVGGCCRVRPRDITALAAAVNEAVTAAALGGVVAGTAAASDTEP